MVDLKPCPFCGGSAERLELEDEANFGGSVICCQRCGASSPVHFDRKENLYDSWNRRTEAKRSPEQAEEASCVVCATPEQASGGFTDNVHGKCFLCDKDIVWRPTAPQKPIKVCIECAVGLSRAKH